MANLFFPQLSSGALVQYPLRKTSHLRTVLNSLPDGTVIGAPDPYSGTLRWELVYQDLSLADKDLLQVHFQACSGPWLPFVFIDPVGNMLNDSGNFQTSSWQLGSNIAVQGGAADPFGANTAFLVTNNGQTVQGISQTLSVPAKYQYVLSIYASSQTPSNIRLVRQADSQDSVPFPVFAEWVRLVSSGRLGTSLTSFTVGIQLDPGHQVLLAAPQLEPQIMPSRYRQTAGAGGVYPNAHWALNNLTFSAASPSLFSTSCVIETRA